MKFPLDRLEIVCVDDCSDDNTLEVFNRLSPSIDAKYVRVRKEEGVWRDCARNVNHGIRITTGSAIIATHPEVLFGRETVQQFLDHVKDGNYVCAKPYYLTPQDQTRLDTVDWVNEGPLAVRKIAAFYDPAQHTELHKDYVPTSIETIDKWESWVVGGHTRATFKKLGGFLQTEKWGAVDLLYHSRRKLLGMENVTLQAPETFCVHQNHDAPRDVNVAHKEAFEFSLKPQNALCDHLW